MSFDSDPLRGSIASVFGSSSTFARFPSGDQTAAAAADGKRGQSTLFFVSDPLPCDQYTLNLTVGLNQAMTVQQFQFAPCLPESGTPASVSPAHSSSTAAAIPMGVASAPTAAAASSSGTEHKPLRAGVIVGLVLSSLFVLFALGAIVVLLCIRRQRQQSRSRFRPWLRLPGHRNKLSPSAQYLASVSTTTGGGGGGGELGHPSKTMTMFNSASASTSKASLLVPAPNTVGGSSPALPAPAGPLRSQMREQEEGGVLGYAVSTSDSGKPHRPHPRYSIRMLP
jgi:hypothetical protein